MATASVPGFRAKLSLATSSSGGTVVAFGELKEFTLTVAGGALDATSKDSAGWKENLPGLREWSGSGSGLYLLETTDVGQTALYNALTGLFPVYVELKEANSSMAGSMGITNVQLWKGMGVVTGFDIESPLDGPAGAKIAIKGTAALTALRFLLRKPSTTFSLSTVNGSERLSCRKERVRKGASVAEPCKSSGWCLASLPAIRILASKYSLAGE